jgi:aspartyl-tRNA(Asn)/glutamyl-tRNA(Gln) amidotransferase subunit C
MNKETLQVEKYAKLARLQLKPEEQVQYESQLSDVLKYVDQLQEVDTSDVPELVHASTQVNAWREDVASLTKEIDRKQIIEGFPQKEGDLLKVQAVFEERNEV